MTGTKDITRIGLSRRAVLAGISGSVAATLAPSWAQAQNQGQSQKHHQRIIPTTGEAIPAIGMGSWQTMNVGGSERLRRDRLEVVRTFFAKGGAMIDSSPMYGSSEEVIGWCLEQLGHDRVPTFSTTKVWTHGREEGIREMEESRRLWGVPRFDLMQVHNLVDWQTHLQTLFRMKAEGQLRYVGVTTSHGRRHDELARILETEPLDFVQLTYNILHREAEQRLLPIAQERGIAVIANMPFHKAALFGHVGAAPLPGWAAEIGAENWAQVFLKFIISHPALTVAIPATSRVDHMRENMGALTGPLPDAALRERMARDVAAI